jgi:group I intron endonuclease
MGIIYKLTSPSGQAYVGQTVQKLAARIGNHRCRSRCYAIHNAIKKYGLKAFDIAVLAYDVPTNELDAVEDHFIVEHNTLKPNGYNLVRGRPERNKRARYERFKKIAKEFSNTESFKQKKKALWQDPEWRAAWSLTWAKKREASLEGLTESERKKKLTGFRRNARNIAKRQAARDPETKAEWERQNTPEMVLHRRNFRFARERVEKVCDMEDDAAIKYLQASRNNAIKTTRKTNSKRTVGDVGRWYPDVANEEELRVFREGKWLELLRSAP